RTHAFSLTRSETELARAVRFESRGKRRGCRTLLADGGFGGRISGPGSLSSPASAGRHGKDERSQGSATPGIVHYRDLSCRLRQLRGTREPSARRLDRGEIPVSHDSSGWFRSLAGMGTNGDESPGRCSPAEACTSSE